ncbi:hypothetical protein AO265_13385 [Pseudomonas sp. ABAC61]|nr:hypothetical protein AO265_13385 [Pseudomonas sp. ABAC61]
MRVAAFCLLWIIMLPASAALYRYIDDEGHRTFSDRPPGDSPLAIEEPAGGSIRAPIVRPSPIASPPRRKPYTQIRLDGITDQETLRANNGSLRIRARLQPPLQPSHRLRLVLDGEPHGSPSRGPQLQLENLDRGRHRLVLQVLEGERVLQQSPEIVFVLLRVHR